VQNISIKEVLATSIFFAVATVLFLRFSILPYEFGTHLQYQDSILIAAVTDHVSRWLTGENVQFWQLGIFYPLKDTICLSEPMLTPALILAPLFRTVGYVASYNLWLYLSWWSLAMAVWLLLRKSGTAWLPAIWAGLYASFNPDRAWHAAGHGHLVFQAGIIYGILCIWRGLETGKWRWKLAFFLSVFAQFFAGFYISVISALWAIPVYGFVAWFAASGDDPIGRLRHLWRGGKFIAVVPVLVVGFYAPILLHYSAFGNERAQNSLDYVIKSSATVSGYVVPPADDMRVVTVPGKLLQKKTGPLDSTEDFQYLGMSAIVLVMAGGFYLLLTWKSVSLDKRQKGLVIGTVVGGLLCFVLSLGPTWNQQELPSFRLPFAYIYAWVEPIRFFRAPARFAFGVEWSVAILGGLIVDLLYRRVKSALGQQGGLAAPAVGCVLIGTLAIEFYPINTIDRLLATPTQLVQWQKEMPREPYVRLPIDDVTTLREIGWSGADTANGYSGYAPENRLQELSLFESSFPGPESMALLNSWKIKQVYTAGDLARKLGKKPFEAGFEKVKEDSEGVLWQHRQNDKTVSSCRHERLNATTATVLIQPIEIVKNGVLTPDAEKQKVVLQYQDMERTTEAALIYNSGLPSTIITMTSAPLSGANYSTLHLRYRISNWYSLNENAAIYWTTATKPKMDEGQKIEFVVKADGKWHDLELPLDDKIVWIAADPIKILRVDLGMRAGNRLELGALAFR